MEQQQGDFPFFQNHIECHVKMIFESGEESGSNQNGKFHFVFVKPILILFEWSVDLSTVMNE